MIRPAPPHRRACSALWPARAALVLVLFLASQGSAAGEWHRADRSAANVLIYTLGSVPAAKPPAAGPATAKPVLAVECDNGQTRLVVHWHQPMAGDYDQAVRYRIEPGSMRTDNWRLSTDRMALGHWGGRAIAVIRQLREGRSLTVHATAKSGAALQATFDVTDLGKSVDPVARACRWP